MNAYAAEPTEIVKLALIELDVNSPGGIEALERRVDRLAADGKARDVRVDFAGVRFVSTQVLGQLLRLHKRMSNLDGRVLLLNLDPNIREVFHISRLEILFQIDETPSSR